MSSDMRVAHVHRDQRKWQADGHGHHAPNKTIPMQLFSFASQSRQYFRDVLFMHDISRIHHVKFLAVGDLFGLELGVRRREALQAPFLVGNALQALVTVEDQRFPPSCLCGFPLRPRFRSSLYDAVWDGGFFGWSLGGSLAKDKGLSRREREEEDFAHRRVEGG
jgi:hypothetical protein